jgi:mono/diheme cytochrome c family protein
MRKRMRRGWPAGRRTTDRSATQVIAKRVVFGSLVFVMAVCTWTIGRAAEEPGQRVYDGNCKRCHGAEGRGAQGPNLIPFTWSYEKALDLIRHPLCDMPPFRESDLSDEEVAQIVTYLKTVK